MNNPITFEDEKEWLEWRKSGVTATDITILMGHNTHNTPLDLFLEKTGQVEHENLDDNPIVRFGKLFEKILEQMFTEETGIAVLASQQCYQQGRYLATLDCVLENAILELKTTNKDITQMSMLWYGQVQWQMFVAGCHKAYLYAYNRSTCRTHLHVIEYDEEYIQEAILKADSFLDCVDSGIPPAAITAHDYERKAALIPDSVQDISVEVDFLEADIRKYQELGEQIKRLEGEQKHLKNVICETLGDNEIGLIDGTPAATWKLQKSSRFDQTTFKKEYPELAEKFLKESFFRVLRIKNF